METNLQPETRQRICDCLYAGQKIAAVKLYREATQSDLARAKAAVDQMESELRAAVPEKFKMPQVLPAVGCLLILAYTVVGVFAGMLLWANHIGDVAAEQRYNQAFCIGLLVMTSVNTCVWFQNPRRKGLAYFGLVVTLLLMFSMICRALRI